jgi:hypothetical protein
MAQTRVLVAVDPATGTRITRRTARTYVAVVVTGDPAQGQAWPQNWAGRPDLAAKQLAKWGAGSDARLAPVVEDPWAEAEAEAAPAPAPAQAEPAPVVAEPEAEIVAHLCRKFPISTPATWAPAVARLQARGAAVTVGAILRETERPAPVLPGEARPGAAPEPLAQVEIDPYRRGEWQRTGIGPDPVAVAERRAARWAERNPEHSYRVVAVAPRPVLPGETEPPAPVAQDGPAPDLPNLATPAPTGDGWAGQPWDPGTPDARARVALQGERVATLWPIAQAARGAGFDLPPAWWADGPILAGERTYVEALAALPLGAIAAAAAALAALPPVTAAQDRALRLCRGDLAAV